MMAMKTNHHALLCVGATFETKAIDGVEDTVLTFTRMGIDDVRALQQQVFQRSVESKRRFIVIVDTITTEAQNALLKILEEPPADTQFILVVPNAERLLPTVRSRLEIVDSEEVNKIDESVAREFIQESVGERLEEIATRSKDKDVAWMQVLVSGLEIEAGARSNTRLMQSLMQYRQYETLTGASKKMLLEDIALAI